MVSESICNLSRLPMGIEKNPLYQTCLEILDNDNINIKDTSLYSFIKTFKPKTLGDIFGINELLNIPHTYVFLPWLHFKPTNRYSDTAFIDFDIKDEFVKLKNLIKSIQDNGYIPKKYPDRKGGITGYYLGMGDIKRLYIVSGNHRVSVLSALGMDIIWNTDTLQKPREYYGVGLSVTDFPNGFYGEDVEKWPSVKSGFLKEEQALKILNKYLETK